MRNQNNNQLDQACIREILRSKQNYKSAIALLLFIFAFTFSGFVHEFVHYQISVFYYPNMYSMETCYIGDKVSVDGVHVFVWSIWTIHSSNPVAEKEYLNRYYNLVGEDKLAFEVQVAFILLASTLIILWHNKKGVDERWLRTKC